MIGEYFGLAADAIEVELQRFRLFFDEVVIVLLHFGTHERGGLIGHILLLHLELVFRQGESDVHVVDLLQKSFLYPLQRLPTYLSLHWLLIASSLHC